MFKDFAVKKQHSQKWFIKPEVLSSKYKASLLRNPQGTCQTIL